MASATFVTAGCGNCHPGGGPLEYDRDGKRYDLWMSDPASGLTPGGDNRFDGDFYKARWSETGVIEADCLLCHLPEYNLAKRNEHLKKLNFRWAATEGAGFGKVIGTVATNHRRGVWLAWMAMAALSPLAAESTTPSAKPWYSPLKDIEVGPGRLDIGLNVRTRYEVLDNFNILGYGTDSQDDVLLFRTRVSADYRFAEAARTFVEFQDARYWLSDLTLADFGRSSSYYDEFDLRQAYLEWRHMGESPFGMKLGRQILRYGDRRVFAPAEWGNVGNYWWDAAKLYYDTDAIQVDALYAQRVLSEPKDWNFDHWPYHVGAVYARIGQLPVTLDAFYVVKHDWSGNAAGERGTGNETRHSFGFFSERPPDQDWDFGLFVAGQVGDCGGDEVRAFGVIARGGYTFKPSWQPRVGVEFNYASGDHRPSDGVAGTFDGIFGAMDIPYGWMNVVSWKNLENYAVNVSVKPAQSLNLSAEYHYFRLAQAGDAWYWVNGRPERRDPTGGAGRDLGHEVDVIGRWQVSRELEVLAGYSHFFAGDYLRRTAGNAADANWVFLQLTIDF